MSEIGVVREVDEAGFDGQVLAVDGPVLVEFFATWCGACRRLAPVLDRLAGEWGDRIGFVKVNVDQSPQLAARYGVTSTPTLMVFDSGQPAGDRLVGAHPETAVRHLITTALPDRSSSSREDQPSDRLGWVPVEACTLPTAEQPLRLAEFAGLFTTALRGVVRPAPTRLRLTIDAAAQDRARDLAWRESNCCSFFTFTFIPTGGGSVWLDVDVPATHVEVLDGLAAQAIHAAGVGR